MKEMKQRDFHLQFYPISKGFEKVRVFGREDKLIGTWVPAGAEDEEETGKSANVAGVKQEEVVAEQEKEVKLDKLEVFKELKSKYEGKTAFEPQVEAEVDDWICTKCGRGGGERWTGVTEIVDGYEEREICGICYKKFRPLGYKKKL